MLWPVMSGIKSQEILIVPNFAKLQHLSPLDSRKVREQILRGLDIKLIASRLQVGHQEKV